MVGNRKELGPLVGNLSIAIIPHPSLTFPTGLSAITGFANNGLFVASVLGFDRFLPSGDSHPFDGLSSAVEH
jgi:hypothetical protein